METKKKRDWGLIVAGILLIICAFFFILAPGVTLITLAIFAGAAFLVAGVFDIINYFRFRKTGGASGWTIFYAILDILLGLMFLFWPVTSAAVIAWVVGIFVLIFGVFEIVAAFKLRKASGSMWGWVLFSGIVSVIVGLMFFFWPASLGLYIAIIVFMRGITLIMYGVNSDNRMWA